MNIINEKYGRIVKEGEFFYLEKNYKRLDKLMQEVDKIIDRIEENNFIYLDNSISTYENPHLELDLLYGKETVKYLYKNTFKLLHVTI